MTRIEVDVPCTVTIVIETDDWVGASTADLGRWVNENHVELRVAVEKALSIESDRADLWFNDKAQVYLMDIAQVDAQVPRTLGVTTLEWRDG